MKLVVKSFQYVLVLFFYHFSSFSFESLAYRFTRINNPPPPPKKKKKKKKKNQETVQSDTNSRGKKDIDIVNKKGTVQLTFLRLCFHNPKHNFHKP